jgi:hypothetical protein
MAKSFFGFAKTISAAKNAPLLSWIEMVGCP